LASNEVAIPVARFNYFILENAGFFKCPNDCKISSTKSFPKILNQD